jgi:hypothetical protein
MGEDGGLRSVAVMSVLVGLTVLYLRNDSPIISPVIEPNCYLI